MKIAIISASRADWSGLGMLALALQARGATVVGAGLSSSAVAAAHADGLALTRAWKWEDSGGVGALIHDNADRMKHVVQFILETQPDVVVVCGDRHETATAAYAVAMMGVPLAHLAGGDVSGGSLDERWRHAITKMADLHFPTHPEAAGRIIRMGEPPEHIHLCGSAAIDRVMAAKLYGSAEIRMMLGLSAELGEDAVPFILANWQPETPVDHGLPELLQALRDVDWPTVFVGANADTGGHAANEAIEAWAQEVPGRRRVAHRNLPPNAYLSALKHCACLVGNSSSGFYEAPYYATPVVNVGDRQKGRWTPLCVTKVRAASGSIALAINRVAVTDENFREVVAMPYGDGHAADDIADVILSYQGRLPGRKQFRDL